jgi:hypothetical protein
MVQDLISELTKLIKINIFNRRISRLGK